MRRHFSAILVFVLCASGTAAAGPMFVEAFFAPKEMDLPDATAAALTANSNAGQLQVRNLRGGGPITVWIRQPGGPWQPNLVMPGTTLRQNIPAGSAVIARDMRDGKDNKIQYVLP